MISLFARVCAEFRDRKGAVLFTIRPHDLLRPIEAPEDIREDPLLMMLVRDRAIDIIEKKEDLKKLENDPGEKVPETAEDNGSAAPAEGKPSGRKNAEKKV